MKNPLEFTVDGTVFVHNEVRWEIQRHENGRGVRLIGPLNMHSALSLTYEIGTGAMRIHNDWLDEQKSPMIKMAELFPKLQKSRENLKSIDRALEDSRRQTEALQEKYERHYRILQDLEHEFQELAPLHD